MNPQQDSEKSHYQFVLSSGGNPWLQSSRGCCNSACGETAGNERISSRKRPHSLDWHHGGNPRMDRKMENGADLNEIERLIASSMTKLSMEDREVAMEDVHGIRSNNVGERGMSGTIDSTTAAGSLSHANASPMEDGNADTAACLQEMEALLQRSQNNAYLLAMRLNPEYVQSTNFRLSFLNCLWGANPKEAVDKILRFLELKLELFGKDALCRDLTLADLDESTLKCLQSGLYQYLGRDSVGRRVIGSFPFLLKFDSPDDVIKMEFFWWTTVFPIQDPANRDMVVVQYTTCMPDPDGSKYGISIQRRQWKTFCSMPIKPCAWHITLDGSTQHYIAFQVIKAVVSHTLHNRIILHFGNHLEAHYSLRRYGINTDPMVFPVSMDGKFSYDIHRRYLQNLEQKEKTDISPSLPMSAVAIASSRITPTEKDVIFGRGFNIQYHPGNIAFRKMLEKYYHAFEEGGCVERSALADHISSSMKSQLGVRFLKAASTGKDKSNKTWVEETDTQVIRSKFFQAFRNLRASYRRASNQP